jgi:hypothetical protein
MCSSTSLTLRGRPTFTGTTDIGNSTEFRSAKIGTIFECGTKRSAHIVVATERTTRLTHQQLVIALRVAVVRNVEPIARQLPES